MKLINCDFNTWSKNHSPEHKDRNYRELYPYKVFQKIDFSEDMLNAEQTIEFNGIKYFALIQKIEHQENNRYRTLFELSTISASKTQKWKKRSWNERFQIIYSSDFHFITVYTKNEDSSKYYLKRFFKGSFEKITENRSIPISDLLFRSFILNLSEDLYGQGNHYEEFRIIPEGIIRLPENPQFKRNKRNFFAPIYSRGRDLWICHSFSEEKAHRIGIYNGNQTKELIVVYCNPTYTKHHRCKYDNVQVISLFEFVYKKSRVLYNDYDRQIRFLQNHLNAIEDYSIKDLIAEITYPSKNSYDIYKSELLEALGIMKIIPANKFDLFYYLSSMNLINAWINRNKRKKNKKLFSDMYYFKTYLSKTLTHLIVHNTYGARIYLEANLAIIELNAFQFSFHHLPMSDEMTDYLNSEDNIEIVWSGKRLQPIAPIIMRYAHELSKT